MDLSSGAIATLVVLGVAGFAIGNFMGARPKAYETRVADFRLMARQFGIYPKLVACPTWLTARYDTMRTAKSSDASLPSAKKTTPMIAQYSLVMDELSLPMAQYLAHDGLWQLMDIGVVNTQKGERQVRVLDGTPIELPDGIGGRVLGLSIKANAIALYWLDDKYQFSHKAHKLDKAQATADLTAMQASLQAWAMRVQQA